MIYVKKRGENTRKFYEEGKKNREEEDATRRRRNMMSEREREREREVKVKEKEDCKLLPCLDHLIIEIC